MRIPHLVNPSRAWLSMAKAKIWVLFGLFLSWPLWGTVGAACGAEIQAGSTPGEQVYVEDFTNPGTVDAGAGEGPGLDQTAINGADQLVQITASGSSFFYNFDNPAIYTFDPGRIEVSSSLAQLVDSIFGDVVGYWRMEEASWNGTPNEVLDSSGNGLHGTAAGGATTLAAGKVGRAGTFDSVDDLVVLGQPAALDLAPTSEFTLAAWFKTPTRGAILAKAVDDFSERQFYLFTINGRLWGAVGGNQNFGNTNSLNDDQWHHAALVNFDDEGVMRYRLYIDGVLDGIFDSGIATNSADVLIGARRTTGNSGSAFSMDGEIDEAMIIGRALSGEEVAGLYNDGAGRIVQEFPADQPTITKTAGDTSPGVTGFVSFTEVLGSGNQGGVEYQLSSDGVVWQFWNGLSWVPATLAEHNDAATVHSNISMFDASSETLFVRSFLLSDGSQRVELDRLEIGFVRDFSGSFAIPYDVPANYTFDPTRVLIEGSLAKLEVQPPFLNDLVGYWRMEEALWNGTADEVLDSSGGGHHGTAFGDATTVSPGQIGRAGTFDGSGDAVVIGQPPELDLLPSSEFTLAAWFRTTSAGAILGQAVNNFSQRQYYIFVVGGQFGGTVGGRQNFGNTTGVDDGQWHLGTLVNFNDAGTMRYRLYLDAALDGEFLSGTATTDSDLLIGARRTNGNSGLGFLMDGEIDEAMIFDRALSPVEVAQLYNAGAGVVRSFPNDGPTVSDNSGNSDTGLVGYTDFLERAGLGHEGQLAYQLSDDGVTWRYWDGGAWTVATLPTHRNSAAVVDAEISNFDPSAQQIFVRAFLLSDGSEAVELDQLTIRYDTAQGAGSTEILGPVQAGFQFLHFSAAVSQEDADHFITFQFLEGDAVTPVSDAVLPGNSAGFDSTMALAGIDLSAIGAGDLYLKVLYSNLAADSDSAALDDFAITYLDFNDDSDLEMAKSADVEPVTLGGEVTYTIALTNAGPSVGFNATMSDPLPAGTEFISLATSANWSCSTPAVGSDGTVVCVDPLLPVGGPYLFTMVIRVPESYGGPNPLTNTATASAAKDSDPSDNSASVVTTAVPPALGSITIVKDAVPDQGTDFDFTGDLGPFTLDDAVPDDGDGVFDSITFTDLPEGDYTVAETVPPNWRRTDFTCDSNILSLVFDTPYNDPLNYTFETDEIEVTGGLARLRQDPLVPDLLGYWRMEEAAWNGTLGEVIDMSGNDLHGTAAADATTTASGLIGRGGTFDGNGDAVVVGQPEMLDLDPAVDEFTLSAWFRTFGDAALIAKADSDFAARQYYMFVFGNRLYASIGGALNAGGSIGAADNQWHHGAIVNFDDGGIMRYIIYFDGENIGTFNSGSATNAVDVTFGARRGVGGAGFDFNLNGQLDEAMIIGRALTPTEILGLYNDGAGRVVAELSSSGPDIIKTFGDFDSEILTLDGFDVTLGPNHQGGVEYQLSIDGIAWQYFDGAAWVSAADSERNDAATVDANIATFDRSTGRLFVRAFLVSDGTRPVELDAIRVPYTGRGLGDTFIIDDTATLGLHPGQDMVCTFVNEVDPAELSSITLRKEATPEDGTDFSFSGDLGSFTLDDAVPDDGDLVPEARTFSDLLAATYAITEDAVPGFNFTGFNCDPGPTQGSFETPFTFNRDYTFDSSKVEVAEGVARLLKDQVGLGLVGYYRMDEAFWDGTADEVIDSSGNDLHGTAEANATTLGGGVIGRSGTFGGGDDLVNLGQPSALDFNPAVSEFTLTAWFKAPNPAALIAKADADFDFRQFYLFVSDDRVWANLGGSQNPATVTGASDDEWHHAAVVNFNDAGVMRYRIYFDGVQRGEFLSGTATNDADILIGARRAVGNTGSAFNMNGEIDEVAIINRALTDAEIAALYNGGNGRVIREYPTDGPTVFETAGDGGIGLLGLTSFQDILGPENEGAVEYQLSTDAVNWQYWDGGSWVLAGDEDRNTAAAVDANIPAFDITADRLFVRAFLLSNGDQKVELDHLSVGFNRLSDVPTFSVLGNTATLQLGTGEDVICTFINEEDAPSTGTIILRKLADPADGTDFSFSGDLGKFDLDFALPDDGDGVPGSRTFSDLAAGNYEVTEILPAGWTVTGLDCTSNEGTDTSFLTNNTATLALDPGETLDCTFENLQILTQITDTTGPFLANFLVATNSDGKVISFDSNRDLTGTNGDLSTEVVVRTVAGFEAVTAVLGPADHAGSSSLSRDGRFVAFASSADLLGSNGDLNREIFLHDRTLDTTTQITFTTGCENATPTVNSGGTRIAFATECSDLAPGFNGDGNREVVLWNSGTFVTTETTGCTSLEPAISREGGDLVAFHADCDVPYTLGNGDLNQEIFLWDWSLGLAGYTQITSTSATAEEFNESVSISHDGRFLLFTSNADSTGSNTDHSAEVFRHDTSDSSFLQLTSENLFVVQSNAAMDDFGQHAAYEKLDLVSSFVSEIFHVDTGALESTAIAQDVTFDSEFPVVARTRNGKAVVFFQSAADYSGGNGDGNVEIWRVVVVPASPFKAVAER